MKNNWILTIIIVVIVGAGAFYGGMKYQQSKTRAAFGQFGGNGQFGGRGGFGGAGGTGGRTRTGNNGRPVVGEIISQDDKSITVKLQDGSSKIVLLPTNASITKSTQGSASDLKVGDRVGVFGTENSDGSVTAQNVQLNPMFRMGGGTRPSVSP